MKKLKKQQPGGRFDTYLVGVISQHLKHLSHYVVIFRFEKEKGKEKKKHERENV